MELESTRRVELKVLRSLFSKPPLFITHLLLTQLLVHIKRSTNDCSNIDLWRRGLDLYRPTPLHFNLSAPFLLSPSAKKVVSSHLCKLDILAYFSLHSPSCSTFSLPLVHGLFIFWKRAILRLCVSLFTCFFSFLPCLSSSPCLLT